MDKTFIINQDNFKCTDNSNNKIDCIDYQDIQNKSIVIEKGQTHTAQIAYKVPNLKYT